MPPETAAEPPTCSLSPDGAQCNCGCPPSHRKARKAAYSAVLLMLAGVALSVAYLAWTSFH